MKVGACLPVSEADKPMFGISGGWREVEWAVAGVAHVAAVAAGGGPRTKAVHGSDSVSPEFIAKGQQTADTVEGHHRQGRASFSFSFGAIRGGWRRRPGRAAELVGRQPRRAPEHGAYMVRAQLGPCMAHGSRDGAWRHAWRPRAGSTTKARPSAKGVPLASHGLVDHIRSHVLDLLVFEAPSESWHRVPTVDYLVHDAAFLDATRKVRLESLPFQSHLWPDHVVASRVARRAVGGEHLGAGVDVTGESRGA